MVEGVDLVVGFERRHVKAAVVERGAPRERTFTAGELSALLRVVGLPTGADPVEAARASIAAADRTRGQVRGDPGAAELPDPFGGTEEDYGASSAAVAELVRGIAFGLFGRDLPGS
jgi:hypothetical protein